MARFTRAEIEYESTWFYSQATKGGNHIQSVTTFAACPVILDYTWIYVTHTEKNILACLYLRKLQF